MKGGRLGYGKNYEVQEGRSEIIIERTHITERDVPRRKMHPKGTEENIK